jgi:IMP cyclohydrolase
LNNVLSIKKSKMSQALEGLASRDYPGRLIVLGRDPSGKNDVVVYGICGRSPSSQARKLEREGDAIWAKPIDEAIVKQGNRELLLYPAIYLSKGVAVSNGRQTADIKAFLAKSQSPAEVLASALGRWNYEPDSPHFTPRIAGCIIAQSKAALGIIRRAADGSSERKIFEFPLIAARGKMIATYEGEDKDPLPSFRGDAVDVRIEKNNPRDMTETIFKALEPRPGKKDYRVSVACVFSPNLSQDEYEIFIVNRQERMMK